MRQVETELLELGLDTQPRRKSADEGIQAVDRDLATCLRHGLGQPRLDPGPLVGERGLPVVGHERSEAAAERGRVVEDERDQVGARAVPLALAQRVAAHGVVSEERGVSLARVVVKRAQEIERERFGVVAGELAEVILEV
jgi:hypothetical protein